MKAIERVLILAIPAMMAACTEQADYDATGNFEATEITVSSEASGRILSFDINEGDHIAADSIVGAIDSLQLSLQLEMLKMQQAAILAAKPDVQKQVSVLKSQISTAERERKRVLRMHQEGAATSKQVDDVTSQINVLRSQLDATMQTLSANVASVDNNAAALEIQMRQLEDRLSKCRIASPVSGTVITKYHEAGEMAVAGYPLMKVADLDNMYMRAYFTSDQLADLKLGQKVTVIADFGGEQQIEYEGTIKWISPESEFTPKSIQTKSTRANLVYAVKIVVKNDGRLKIGLFGEVRL